MNRVVRGDTPIRIRRGSPVDLGRERPEAALVRDNLARHRHGQKRATVEGTVEGDHRRPAGGDARDLDGVLHGLCARVQEDRLLLLPSAWRKLIQAPASFDVGLVHPDHEALVQVAVDLLVDRGNHGGGAMAEVLAAEAAGEVEIALAVDVLDVRSARAGDDQGRGGDTTRDVTLACVDYRLRSRCAP